MNIPLLISLIIPLVMIFFAFVVFVIEKIKSFFGYRNTQNIIPFKTFVALYEINRNKWQLSDSYVIYYTTDLTKYTFIFSLRDTLQYRKWKKRYDKNYSELQSQKRMVNCFKEWQMDIDNYRSKAHAQMEQNLSNIEKEKEKYL